MLDRTALNKDCEMMVNNKDEENLLLNSLKKNHVVLEWGSGFSTLAIAKRVKQLYTIEHNNSWFNEIQNELKNQNIKNVNIYFKEQNQPIDVNYSDGTYNNFKDYIEFPKTLNQKFDVIFIDGRSRVSCAKIAVDLLKPNGIIFIHDIFHPQIEYRRFEYEEVLSFLDVIDGVFTMYKFKSKI